MKNSRRASVYYPIWTFWSSRCEWYRWPTRTAWIAHLLSVGQRRGLDEALPVRLVSRVTFQRVPGSRFSITERRITHYPYLPYVEQQRSQWSHMSLTEGDLRQKNPPG